MTTTLTCNRIELRSAVSYILPAISSSVLPVLKHLEMCLDPEQNLIQLNSTDIEIRIGITMPAEIEISGETLLNCLIPAQTFADILGMLEGEQVRLEITDYELLIHTGGSRNRLSLSTEESFPPEFSLAVGANLLSLSTGALKQALGRVISAASTDYARPVLNSICFDLKDSDLHLVAADGFRLAADLLQVESTVVEEKTYLIPLKTAQKLLRSLPAEDEALSIQADEGRMLFRWGERRFWASRLDGTFPNWRQIVYMPDGFTLPGDAKPFSREGLVMAVKRAEIFARDGGIPHLIHFLPSEVGMQVSGKGDQVGQSEEEVACDIQVPFNLNGLYLVQALTGMEREFPHLHLTGSNQPVIFAEKDFVYVIMPLTILEESVPVKNAEEAVPA
jgi:DNA polymerase III subunit beta